MNNYLKEGKRIFESEIESLGLVCNELGKNFELICKAIANTEGKVIITGVGKPGHIATKAAATFSSLGIPSFYLHPAEAQHGDLGMIQSRDLVIAISYSGESIEVTKIIPNIKMIGAKIIGITGNGQSSLAKMCDITEVFPKFEEAGYLKLAPTSSTTVELVYLDALAISVANNKGFNSEKFGLFHPAGSLGKKLLLKVKDIMIKGDENAVVGVNATLKEAISEMCGKPIGLLNIVDSNNMLLGIITDGDIRRAIYSNKDINSTTVESIMTRTPIYVQSEMLAFDALNLMIESNVQSAPVLFEKQIIGTLQIKDIYNEGIRP